MFRRVNLVIKNKLILAKLVKLKLFRRAGAVWGLNIIHFDTYYLLTIYIGSFVKNPREPGFRLMGWG